jgi:hypothetical protein
LIQRLITIVITVAMAVATAAAQEKLSRLQGSVNLGRNAPVIGATALVLPQERPTELYLTSSDGKGGFRVDGLPDGLYDVRVVKDGLAPLVKQDISVRFPFRAVVEMEMAPLKKGAQEDSTASPSSSTLEITGKVVELDAGPLSEVQLRFVNSGGGDDPRILRSGPDGNFDLGGISAGEWRIEVKGVGLLPQRMVLELKEDVRLTVIVVRQPPGYEPTPLELMPAEQPIPPA